MYTSTKRKSNFSLPKELEVILLALKNIGAMPILVGGCVRDHFLNIPIKDYDIEVFNIESFEKLALMLESFGRVELVGKFFGVLKLFTAANEYDFALPRQEKKVAKGHQGFDVTTNSSLSFEQAAIRRDFTMNAIGYDFFEDSFLDPFKGREAIEKKELKHINETTFIEDPLRVYRAISFAARFDFILDTTTFSLCQNMITQGLLEELAKERIFEEFKKFLLQASKPSLGFTLMRSLGILNYYPELQALIGCEQDKEYHPEGDVWVHTLMCLDEMAKLRGNNSKENIMLMLATLCHDFGKPLCTKVIKGRITSHKHEALGVEPTVTFLKRLTNEKKLVDEIIPLVKYHLSPFQLYLQNSTQKAVKRLSTKVNIEQLCQVALADCLGRTIPNKQKCHKAIAWLLKEAKTLDVSSQSLQPLVQGKDLIALGFKPSKAFKEILDFAFDLQIEEDMPKEMILQKIDEKFKV